MNKKVAHAHLRMLNPLPQNLAEVLRAYKTVLMPEMNLGQLAMLLRAAYLVDVQSFSRVRGLPLSPSELASELADVIETTAGHTAEHQHLEVTEDEPQLEAVGPGARSSYLASNGRSS